MGNFEVVILIGNFTFPTFSMSAIIGGGTLLQSPLPRNVAALTLKQSGGGTLLQSPLPRNVAALTLKQSGGGTLLKVILLQIGDMTDYEIHCCAGRRNGRL